jgi:uncharacterized protein YbaR (Trm112 family)
VKTRANQPGSIATPRIVIGKKKHPRFVSPCFVLFRLVSRNARPWVPDTVVGRNRLQEAEIHVNLPHSPQGIGESGDRNRELNQLSDDFLGRLVCPDTHTPLVRDGDWLYNTSPERPRRYPIRDGIPVMLIPESEEITRETQQAVTN